MKMNRQMIIAGILTAILCMTLFLGCGPVEVINRAENVYSKEYKSFCTRTQDPRMTIDGVLDEELWEGKAWFTNTFMHNVYGVYPTLQVTGFPTEFGIYVAAVTDDTNIVNNG